MIRAIQEKVDCGFYQSGISEMVELITPIAQLVKNPPAMQETLVQFLGQEDPLEKE